MINRPCAITCTDVAVSDVDLWTWILMENPHGSVVNILDLGKDGFSIDIDSYKALNRQTQQVGTQVRLVICHDKETQRRNGTDLSPHWVQSVGRLSKCYAESWLCRLVANMEGAANDLDYRKGIQTYVDPKRLFAKLTVSDLLTAMVLCAIQRSTGKCTEFSRCFNDGSIYDYAWTAEESWTMNQLCCTHTPHS